MKKLGFYLASFLLLLVLSACGAKDLDKSEVLAKSIEESTALKSYSIKMDLDIDADGMEQKMSIDGDITHNPDAMYFKMNMEALGMDIISEMYMNKDAAYMSMFGEWLKMDTKELGITSFDQLNEESMEKLKSFTDQFEMTEDDEKYILTLSGNDETYKVLIEDYVSSSMGTDLAANPEMEELLNSIKINQIDLEYHVDKESFIQTTQVFNIDLEMDMEGTKIPLKMKGEATISNINGVDPIEIPQEAIDNAVTEDEMYSGFGSMSVDEIQELSNYVIVEPTNLPEGYVYTEGFFDETMEMAMLSYDKDENNWILVSSNPVEHLSLQDMEGDEIAVRGTTGVLFEMEDYVSISWEEDGLLYEVSASSTELTKEQVLEVVESIQ
ncbi:DUF4367 domain-containing protein [Ureibacillus manganicus]|uniref:DUF4367 domain-containing protein n=1 Tax=Ureibacillus manganicus DSM 26584 TaxID=1384049 RepID=A0A0A3HZ38_9BACL|nr:DUF4367 domain-containing protein [Ureibacillus manganicus]KGR77709.1 hypothetical protein CD29_13730 [Ureibacillus manganicus DSM 26584]